MSFLQNLGERIPSGDRLYMILAVVVIVAALVVSIAFVGFFLLPQLETRSENAAEVAAVEQQVLLTRQADTGPEAEELQQAIATKEAEVDEVANTFFADTQAAGLLDRLYAYADQNDVEIINLQNVPEREQETENPVYDVNAFQLEATGSVADLLDFLSSVREASSTSFVIDDVSITESDRGPLLVLDFAIYTSPRSSRDAVEPTPQLTRSPVPEDLAELEEALDTAQARRDWEQVIRILRQIGAISRDYPDLEELTYTAYVEYGYQLLEEGRFDEAETQFNLALGIRPNGEEALTGLARVAFTPTPTMTALQALEDDLDAAWADENWVQVISILEQIEAIEPDYAGLNQKLYAAYVNRGYTLVEQGNLIEARAAFVQALEINPEGGEAARGLQQLAGDITPQSQPPATEPPQGGFVTYVVQPGDNLFRISLRYGVSQQEIMAANNMTSTTVRVGQELRIPVD